MPFSIEAPDLLVPGLPADTPLQRTLREQQTLLDSAGVGIVFIRQRVVVRCNPRYAELFGYGSPRELVGQSSEVLHPSREAFRALGRAAYATLSQGQTFRTEWRMRRRNGEVFWSNLTGRLINPDDTSEGSIWTIDDIDDYKRAREALDRVHEELERQVRDRTRELSETVENLHHEINDRKHDQERIYWLAHYDPLTGLPNRTLLAERSRLAISAAQESGTPLAVVFLDLDHFKHVNDSLGHRVGDALLVEIAKRLRAVVRDKDTVSRLGGDEFVLLLPGASAHGAARVAGKLLDASRQPYQIEHHELTMAPSMGIALYPSDGEDFDTLTQSADTAMYRAKRDGRNTFRFFTPEMQAQSVRALQLENALRRALERNQFELHYQPQVTIATGKVRSLEALLRWQHPELGPISPAEFIPVAEDSGQILQIGEWVLRNALAQLQAWRAQGLTGFHIAVNLSAIQFHQPQLPDLVSRILTETGLPPDSLELELTEGVAVDDPHAAIATMDQLHALGVRLAMDDFGTGYSSLSHLKRFQIYKLKIDQSFVRDLGHDGNDRAIISAIIRMAQALGLQTTAEGVESEAQLAFLREQGCDDAQGYHFSPPLPACAIEAYLRAQSQG
jgi:diguanylate cyclase (GGDEF)-like protein/PAS domain S-box-containing protein